MDVGGKNKYPGGKLSNFTAFKFTFDGVECASMEGLLQSFKFEKKDSQVATCLLTSFAAKKKGSGRNSYWKSKQTLWWNGVAYKRNSKEYQLVLNRAYNALFKNEHFKKTLNDAGSKSIFTHKIGNNNKKETVLTESEFCKRLQHLKDKGELNEN